VADFKVIAQMGHAHQAKTAVCMQVHWGRDTHWIALAPPLQWSKPAFFWEGLSNHAVSNQE